MIRLTDSNIEVAYGSIDSREERCITNFTPLLQKDYGKDKDCTLTSITAILGGNPQETYDKVEKIALKYGYNGDTYGTIPIFTKSIIDKASGTKSKQGYLKNIGYSWKKIQELINNNQSIILSLNKDGRDYYKNHSVVIVGWVILNNKTRLLKIYDNWYLTPAYIDYDKLSLISSINYMRG